jgi:hypothetical protein
MSELKNKPIIITITPIYAVYGNLGPLNYYYEEYL